MSTNLLDLVNSYFLIMFIVGFTFMGIDKWKAINSRWRIPERQLWLIACIGGAAGTWLGMIIFRHKIRHNHFVYGFTMLTIIEVFILYVI
ncbi:DUF1294 domain-containing protein [Rummeliibacillus sp. TYF005]|uniref:DUF1294 domain-containing protein n=1 Tax=unclassified Rummeliibacillus TaxID=2622809 RepID=UPI000E66F3EA|nr:MULTISPECIES: DUF1294 domain-containing protein [unclassified Rummeliibacillus]RIJ63091.1 DUF1294 domain-containing protein [Rummeliibacillus sp. POC4]RPJ97174.1 DUF1294 domain-containing protein [Rummeliibacillus sp. TYF005]